LSNVDDADPLYQFAFNSSGTQVMFYTDSTITHWGTDYWGYWDEPYIVEDGVVSYTIGLSSTTYLFEDIGNNTFLVSKIVVTSPYNGGPSNTTETTPGEYSLLP
jgi:hypothetical protein